MIRDEWGFCEKSKWSRNTDIGIRWESKLFVKWNNNRAKMYDEHLQADHLKKNEKDAPMK